MWMDQGQGLSRSS